MPVESSRAARVGLVVLVATVLAAVFLLQISSGSGPFDRRVRYVTRFPTAQGLAVGAEVRYKGVPVGTVKEIELADEQAANDVVVSLSVSRDLASRIDAGIVAELRSSGPLGDRLVELRRDGGPTGPPLPPGSLIPGKEPFEIGTMMRGGTDIVTDIQSISQSLRVITDRLVAGEGLFGRLLKDKEFGEQTMTDLQVSLARLRQMMDAAAEGRSLVGSLVGDTQQAAELAADLQQSIDSLQRVTARVEAGEGALGQMTRDDSEMTRAVADFGVAARRLRSFTERLESANGLAPRLFFDEELGRTVSEDVAATARHVRSIAEKVDAGQGSAGMLVNDRQVYEGVSDIVRGVERSWFVNFVLKRKRKKGFEDRVDRILRESPDPDRELLELVREVLEVEEAEGPPAAPAPVDGTLPQATTAPGRIP